MRYNFARTGAQIDGILTPQPWDLFFTCEHNGKIFDLYASTTWGEERNPRFTLAVRDKDEGAWANLELWRRIFAKDGLDAIQQARQFLYDNYQD